MIGCRKERFNEGVRNWRLSLLEHVHLAPGDKTLRCSLKNNTNIPITYFLPDSTKNFEKIFFLIFWGKNRECENDAGRCLAPGFWPRSR